MNEHWITEFISFYLKYNMTNTILFIFLSPICLVTAILSLTCEFHSDESDSGRKTLADQWLFWLVISKLQQSGFFIDFNEDISAAEQIFSGRAGGLCHCVATEGRPDCVAAARLAGRTGMPACSPSKSAAPSSCTDIYSTHLSSWFMCLHDYLNNYLLPSINMLKELKA